MYRMCISEINNEFVEQVIRIRAWESVGGVGTFYGSKESEESESVIKKKSRSRLKSSRLHAYLTR